MFAASTVGVFIGVTFVAERWDYTVVEHGGGEGEPGQSLAFLRTLLGVGCLGYGGALIVEGRSD